MQSERLSCRNLKIGYEHLLSQLIGESVLSRRQHDLRRYLAQFSENRCDLRTDHEQLSGVVHGLFGAIITRRGVRRTI